MHGEDEYQKVRMETLIKICDVLQCKIDDVIDYSMNAVEREM